MAGLHFITLLLQLIQSTESPEPVLWHSGLNCILAFQQLVQYLVHPTKPLYFSRMSAAAAAPPPPPPGSGSGKVGPGHKSPDSSK
jgi:hypothetical protein